MTTKRYTNISNNGNYPLGRQGSGRPQLAHRNLFRIHRLASAFPLLSVNNKRKKREDLSVPGFFLAGHMRCGFLEDWQTDRVIPGRAVQLILKLNL